MEDKSTSQEPTIPSGIVISDMGSRGNEIITILEEMPDPDEAFDLVKAFARRLALGESLPTIVENKGENPIEKQILIILGKSETPVRTLDLAKAIRGPQATKKDINSVVYSLYRMKKVEKHADTNGANPKWSLPSNKK